MKLSIITINYNNAEGLRKTLASVASQTYRNIEHIIVDGASTDGSVEVIREYESLNRSSIHPLTAIWSSEPDKGIYNAINKGIRQATGDYIQILNSGDSLASPDVTERMINALSTLNTQHSSEKATSILYGNMLKDKNNGSKLYQDTGLGNPHATSTHPLETEWTMNDFYCGTINHNPTYIHRSLYEKYGVYDEQLKIIGDWKWFVNVVVFGGEKVYYTPIDVTVFDMNGISETRMDILSEEHERVLHEFLPEAIVKDYSQYHSPIDQYKRLKRHHIWPFVYFIERVLFKLEKWHILK